MACNHPHAASSYPVLNSSAGSKWIKNLTKDRLGTFNGGHYNDVNLGSVLFTHRLDGPESVKLKVCVRSLCERVLNSLSYRWSAPGLTKPTFEEAMQQKFRTAKKVRTCAAESGVC